MNRGPRQQERIEGASGAPGSIQRLCDLPVRGTGIVKSVQGPEDLRRRLLEMGFCNQARVTVIRRAPMGDPIEFRLRGYYVSLRKEEAGFVRVIPLEEETPAERLDD